MLNVVDVAGVGGGGGWGRLCVYCLGDTVRFSCAVTLYYEESMDRGICSRTFRYTMRASYLLMKF